MKPTQRARLGAVAILVLVFGSGVALGLAWDRHLTAAPPVTMADSTATGGGDEEAEKERRPPMYRQVGELTGEQEARIDSIVQHHRGAMKELQQEFRSNWDPRYWAIVDRTRSGIRSVMTAEQIARYDSLVVEYDRERREDDEGEGEDGDEDR